MYPIPFIAVLYHVRKYNGCNKVCACGILAVLRRMRPFILIYLLVNTNNFV